MLPAPGPFWGGNMQEKVKYQQRNVNQDSVKIVRKKSTKEKTGQKHDWKFTINFVSFENDGDRQKSYELWVESFFHFVN